jgi:hypothetical protein
VPLRRWFISSAARSEPKRLSGTMMTAQLSVRSSDGQNSESWPEKARRKFSSPVHSDAPVMLYRVNAMYSDHTMGPSVHSRNPTIQGEAHSHPAIFSRAALDARRVLTGLRTSGSTAPGNVAVWSAIACSLPTQPSGGYAFGRSRISWSLEVTSFMPASRATCPVQMGAKTWSTAVLNSGQR